MPIVKSLNPIKSPTLYELTGELQDALARIEPNPETGELEGMEAFEQLALTTQAKILDCASAIRNFENLIDEISAQQKELAARKKCAEAIIDRIKARCVESMEWMELKSIQSPTVSVALRPATRVEVFDAEQIPREFIRVKSVASLDKIGIGQALKAGQDVPGARLEKYNTLKTK